MGKYLTYTMHQIPISFKILPLYTIRRRFNTSRRNTRKFSHHIKNRKQLLRQELNSIREANQINTFTAALIQNIQQTSKSAYRLKTVRRKPTFSYWTTELKIKRTSLQHKGENSSDLETMKMILKHKNS